MENPITSSPKSLLEEMRVICKDSEKTSNDISTSQKTGQ